MFWRLSLIYGLLVGTAAAILGLFILRRAEEQLHQQLKHQLRTAAAGVREVIRDHPDLGPDRLNQRLSGLELAGLLVSLQTADERGVPVWPDPETRPTTEGPLLIETLPVQREGPVVAVSVAVAPHDLDARMSALRGLVWSAVAVTALCAIVPALVLVRRVTQPLRELTEAVRRIAEGGFGHKVVTTSGDEIGTLARTFNDMSGRLATQFAQLEEDRQQLRTILDGMVEGVVAIDAEQRMLFANERAASLLGFNLPTAVGRKLWEVVRQRQVHHLVERALSDGGPQREEIDWHGSMVKFLTIYVARLPGEPCQGAVLVVHDTSELRRLERMRQDFAANVSHELKTPLSVIKVYVETLQNGAAEDPQHCGPFLDQIAEQADRLHHLILDLLSLAKIESGDTAMEFEPVGLDQAVGDCLERQRARAEAKRQTLEACPANDNQPVVAWADPEAIGTILDNLVDNAIKYTPEGGRICVRWAVDEDNAWFQVEDNGIGIPERDLPRVFERFYRVDKARSREMGGTGLGLAIVKHLVQAMDGRVTAVSYLGQGTTFTIHLPRSADG